MWNSGTVALTIGLVFSILCANGNADSNNCFLCIDGNLMFPFEIDGPSKRSSAAEVCANRGFLENDKFKLSEKDKGFIFLIGVVHEARLLPTQKQEINVKVTQVLEGNVQGSASFITIISPLERDGGIPIVIGEKYRFIVIRINDKFYSWALTGSAPITSNFYDSYRCK